MQEKTRKQIIIVVSAVVASILIVILLVLIAHHDTSIAPVTTGRVHQGNAGAKEEFSITPLKPAVDGFGALLDNGLTTNQLDLVNKAVHRYAPFVKDVNQLTLEESTIHPNFPEQSDPLYRWSVTGNLNADNKATYQMKVYYWGTDTVQVQLFDANGATKLYDSGVMTASSQS